MAYSFIRQGDADQYDVVQLMADEVKDVKNLPTKYAPGSVCIVAEDSSVYMLKTTGEWKAI